MQQASDINFEAKRIGIEIDKSSTAKIFSKKIAQNVSRLAYALDLQQVEATLEILDCINKLELSVDIAEAQNYFFTKIVNNIEELTDNKEIPTTADLQFVCFNLFFDTIFNSIHSFRVKINNCVFRIVISLN